MNFYHLTADIHPSSSSEEPASEEEDGPNWLVIKASPAAPQLSAKKVKNDQAEVQRQIDEIFEALLPSSPTAASTSTSPLSQGPVLRRRMAKTKCSRHRRTLNTMSGYFSDWAKWLTEAHPSWRGAGGSSAEMSLQQAHRNG